MLQARRLGTELLVGVHSDEDILENKGPTVMTLAERLYVVHGDDITSDSAGHDCYRFVKAAGRFHVVKRTPGISTTDLVGRMLLCTKNHFIKSLNRSLDGDEGPGSPKERKDVGEEMSQRIRDYASDQTGLHPGVWVQSWTGPSMETEHSSNDPQGGSCATLVDGIHPKRGQRIVYVDGGFDLFSSGHIEFLRQVVKAEETLCRQAGWYEDASVQRRRANADGDDYAPFYIVAGVHDDEVINYWKGVNYPIMNIYERGLCVLQCRYVDSVVFSAPFTPSKEYLTNFPFGAPDAVYHGPTAFMPLTYDPYIAAKGLGIYREIGTHVFQDVNAGEIVQRILRSRQMYEERQKKKGEKGAGEEVVRRREHLEEEAAALEKARAAVRS
ncbi:MAG: hypothetical protein Q9222_000370 [Ikaeria aurantiellina]